MTRNDDLRERLRASDPARGQDMSPVERARIQAALASVTPPPARPLAPLFALGAAVAAILVAAMLWVSPSPAPAEHHVQAQAPAPAPERAAPREPVTVAAARPSRARRARVHPAVLDVTPRTTRIDFTAPDGTRILWFVGSPDAKELGS